MINVTQVEEMLRQRYPDLATVGNGVFRGVDRYAECDYAIRYFDVNDQVSEMASQLKRYQEEILSEGYFSADTATDLRWNHYLYFVSSLARSKHSEFKHQKSIIESDREYARKQVVLEEELQGLLKREDILTPSLELPADLAMLWMARLDESGLGFILDDSNSVPEVVRRIEAGQKDVAKMVVSPSAVQPSEVAAASNFLKNLVINGFRPHPTIRKHSFGKVNLIFGTNGVGKTSLLEAIEYAYCGRNRRGNSPLLDTLVIAELVGTSEKLLSSTSTALERLRARHAYWYAKAEIKKVTIEDSFGKFNFLDTDAAVKLSLENSSQQIGGDVARLVLGAEAEKLSDRLLRVQERVQDALKDIARNTRANDDAKNNSWNRYNELSKAPKVSDGLFKELQIALGYVGWRVLPENKDNLDSLRRGLHDVISSVGQMHRFNFDVIQSDEATFQFQFRVLEEAITQANELAKEQQEATLNAAEKMREIQLSSNLVAAIDALLPYAQADFQTTYNQLQTSKQSVNAGNSHFVGVRTPTQDDFFQPMLQQTVESVSEQITRRLSELRNSLQEAQQALKKIEATKAGLELLRTRLLSAAKELLEHVPNPDHCPVCHSDFEQGQLLARMVESNTEFSSDELGSIQTEISDVETEFDSISSVDASLKALIDFVGPSAKSLTVAEALLRIEESRAALEQEKSQLSITQNRLVGLESNGLTMTDLLAKLATANFTTLKSEEDLQQVKSTELALQANNRDRLHVIQAQLNKVRQETAVLANIYSLDVFISPQELVLQIRTIHQKLQSTFEAREIMRKYLTVGSVSSLDTLSATLKSMQELINKVQTISAKEVYENKALAQEAALIEQLTNEAKACEVKDRHLNEARILLEQLRQMGSGGALTMRILGENADEIGKTFAKIHMPNEFDIKSEEGELRIIRRQANENVDLVQMSTGQRAAFALSLFLAMNARLQSGPPILLFDDPVAHVDDINVLSFLDHLRDIAINGSRQIFFATADSKLAGLFRHKFRFLGSEDFREVNLVRDN